MTLRIEIDDLAKYFGAIKAVDGVSFSVSKGEVLGFLGPNGAGKSTTMKMITGFLTPTKGTVRVCGYDVLNDPISVKAHLGYLPEGAPAYADMTPDSFLKFIAEIRGIKGADRRRAVDSAAERARITNVMYQPIETLSKGYKRRVGLAQSILHNPPVLILDEPTDGLDPNQKHEVRTLINEMAEDKAIIISTHILEEVHALCTRNVVIANGKVKFDGTPQELESRSRYYNAVVVNVADVEQKAFESFLNSLAFVARVEPLESAGFRVYPKQGQQITAELSEKIRKNGWSIDALHAESGRLDEVFRSITMPNTGAKN
ncbi:MAG: ABC transporter ATP-binding protein [Methylophaga sp.]|uniref:ABC transporter ATP-binding protein n=1 Tax=Methylophaga sp. UBA678 TaxID=1946901 RepID=UPI000C556F3D|nr:ABC transporter ATP-binding protein [Methylophaga sp. UBA678]MAX52098.1 ABC transporter ATP-binding protein [Methylophaga sp.]|tara:strand:- start:26637 stop:27584 length:948 start_codon:yes stop_codon:yes gene_type:complete